MGIAERKEREKQKRREEIVAAAEKVFFSKGFEEATMEEVAETAELSKGTLYLYFSSKDDLHMAVAERAIRLLRDKTSAAISTGKNALEKLRLMGQACVKFASTHPDQMHAIMAVEDLEPGDVSMTTEDVQDLIYRRSTVGTVIEVLEQGLEEETIRSDLPVVLMANTLWMSVLSVIRFISRKKLLMEMLEVSPAEVYDSHFELVINGIRP